METIFKKAKNRKYIIILLIILVLIIGFVGTDIYLKKHQEQEWNKFVNERVDTMLIRKDLANNSEFIIRDFTHSYFSYDQYSFSEDTVHVKSIVTRSCFNKLYKHYQKGFGTKVINRIDMVDVMELLKRDVYIKSSVDSISVSSIHAKKRIIKGTAFITLRLNMNNKSRMKQMCFDFNIISSERTESTPFGLIINEIELN